MTLISFVQNILLYPLQGSVHTGQSLRFPTSGSEQSLYALPV